MGLEMDISASQDEQHTVLQVDGMTCGSCVRTVEASLAAVPGVERAVVDLATGRVHVIGAVQPHELVHAVHGAGYEARLQDAPAPLAASKRSSCC